MPGPPRRQMRPRGRVIRVDGCVAGCACLAHPAACRPHRPSSLLFARGTPQRAWPARWARGLLYCGLAAGPLFVTTFLAKGATRDGYRPGAPSGQLAGARATRPGPGRELRRDRDAVPRRRRRPGHAADPALSSRADGPDRRSRGRPHRRSRLRYRPGQRLPARNTRRAYPAHPHRHCTTSRQSRCSSACPPPRSPAAGSPRAGHHRFGLYCAATATTMLATTALAGAGFDQSPRLVNLAGLFQRASIVTGFGWLTALSAQALARAPAAQARQPST